MANQFERQERQKQDEERLKRAQFINSSFKKFFEWQIEHNILCSPVLSIHQRTGIQPSITFEEMTDEQRQRTIAELAEVEKMTNPPKGDIVTP